jgi:hypothetical protein
MHFQLAGIARAGIDFADGQRAAEDAEQFVVQAPISRCDAIRVGRACCPAR